MAPTSPKRSAFCQMSKCHVTGSLKHVRNSVSDQQKIICHDQGTQNHVALAHLAGKTTEMAAPSPEKGRFHPRTQVQCHVMVNQPCW
jgi:hypothetical protein